MRPMHWLQLATFTECDRAGWLEAIQLASHDYLKSHAKVLQVCKICNIKFDSYNS